jgi:hypothetical protein
MSDVQMRRPGRHRAQPKADKGLTEEQRQRLLMSFRSGVGSKPSPDDEHLRHHMDMVAEKLVDAPIRLR